LNRRVGGELPFPICPLSDAHYSKAVIYRVKRGITRQGSLEIALQDAKIRSVGE
jgi:hypothetical protein